NLLIHYPPVLLSFLRNIVQKFKLKFNLRPTNFGEYLLDPLRYSRKLVFEFFSYNSRFYFNEVSYLARFNYRKLLEKMLRFILVSCLCAILVESRPTMYRMKENKLLEPDMIPVSSTVIPLPVYKVSYGIDVLPENGGKLMKPDGPVQLETVHSKKKFIPKSKSKHLTDVSSVKQIY
ncbi:unnamed protein product, partial [Phyllotreta striolata]